MCTARVNSSSFVTSRINLLSFRVTFVFLCWATIVQVTVRSSILPASPSTLASSSEFNVFIDNNSVYRGKRESIQNASGDTAEISDINYSPELFSHEISTTQTPTINTNDESSVGESSGATSRPDESEHVTPHYRISYEVCNGAQSKIMALDATGTNLTFTLGDYEESTLVRDKLIGINENNHLVLKEPVQVTEATVIVYVKQMTSPEERLADTFTALSRLLPRNNQLESSSLIQPLSDSLSHDNQIYLVLHLSKSFCTDKTTSLSTIIIVTLSVVCLLLLTLLTLAIIVLRRKKPYLFSAKGSSHDCTSSNQVAPCDHVACQRSKDKSLTNGMISIVSGSHKNTIALPDLTLKPRKSSLKPSKASQFRHVPEVTIIPESPTLSVDDTITSPTSTSITSGINSSPISPNDSLTFTGCLFANEQTNGAIKQSATSSPGDKGSANLIMLPLTSINNNKEETPADQDASTEGKSPHYRGNLNDINSASCLSLDESSNRLSPLLSKSALNEAPEKRRRSVVTFNETTQIIQIGKKK